MDYRNLLRRYVGRRVCVSTFGHVKLWGILGSVADDCVRLTDTVTASELDDSPWMGQMMQDDEESRLGNRQPETLLHFHHIVAITCTDSGISPLTESDGEEIAGESLAQSFRSADSPPESDDAAMQAGQWPYTPADRITLLLAPSLVSLAMPPEGKLLDRVGDCRRSFIEETGLPLPLVRVRDDIRLEADHFRLLIDHAEVAQGIVYGNRLMAMSGARKTAVEIEGIHGTDPAFGIPVTWITPEQETAAEKAGYAVLDPSTILTTTIAHVCRRHIKSFLTLDLVRGMLHQVRASAPVLVDEIIPARMPISRLRDLLASLAEERVTLRPIEPILESVATRLHTAENSNDLLEQVRHDIRRQIVQPYRDPAGALHVVPLVVEDCELLIEMGQDVERHPEGDRELRDLTRRMVDFAQQRLKRGERFCVLVEPRLRRQLWELLREYLAGVPILSYQEVPSDIRVVAHGEPEPAPRGRLNARQPEKAKSAKKASSPVAPKSRAASGKRSPR
jgi:flagellar biosynthesis component FlhA